MISEDSRTSTRVIPFIREIKPFSHQVLLILDSDLICPERKRANLRVEESEWIIKRINYLLFKVENGKLMWKCSHCGNYHPHPFDMFEIVF